MIYIMVRKVFYNNFKKLNLAALAIELLITGPVKVASISRRRRVGLEINFQIILSKKLKSF